MPQQHSIKQTKAWTYCWFPNQQEITSVVSGTAFSLLCMFTWLVTERMCTTGYHFNPYVVTCPGIAWLIRRVWEPLWSSGQSSWLQIQRSRFRFQALPDFQRSNGSGTGSTQPLARRLEELLEWKSSGSGFRKPRLTAVGIRCADQATPSIRNSWH
jgi:hypothetical protein